MKLGRNKKPATTTTRRMIQGTAARGSDRRVVEVVRSRGPNRISKFPVGVLARTRRIKCCTHECAHGSFVDPSNDELAVVRFRLGYVTYHENMGPMMHAEFPLNKLGDMEVYAHALCAMESDVRFDLLKAGKCGICLQQFYCEREPKECCVLVDTGYFEDDNGEYDFVPQKRTAVHWACADAVWNSNITDHLQGIVDAGT